MKSIFFPFTYISDPNTHLILTFFNSLQVLQPIKDRAISSMQKSLDVNNAIELIYPIEGEEQRLKNSYHQYIDWRSQNEKIDISFFKTQSDKTPFFNESSPLQLKAHIQNQSKISHIKESDSQTVKTVTSSDDTLFSARLFLMLAEHFDKHRFETEKNLLKIEAFEQKMLDDLICDKDQKSIPLSPSKSIDMAEDIGKYMTKERLANWAHLFFKKNNIFKENTPFTFVTTSFAICNQICETFPQTQKILQIENAPLISSEKNQTISTNFSKIIQEATNTPITNICKTINLSDESPKNSTKNVSLSLFAVPNTDYKQFLSSWFNTDKEPFKVDPSLNNKKCTFISLVQTGSK